MPGIRVEAPAKINLHLKIGEKRSDAYHELESVFLTLAFGDTLRLKTLKTGGSLELRMDWKTAAEDLPPERNILRRAVDLFRARSGFDQGLSVLVKKRIPLGGGLGGGSSDAAALLLGLNRLSGAGLSRKTLGEMAETLGSDVPFFLEGGAAWVSGRGENIRPLDLPEGIKVVLVNPGFPSDTAGAFRLLDEERKNGEIPVLRDDAEEYARALGQDPRKWPFVNDFLPVFLKAGLPYGAVLSRLRELGADFAGLSGSGSTCFGVFTDGGIAKKAGSFLMKQWKAVKLTFPLRARQLW
jgi:4-diphosphocytidyl-2-C-methyl-D-erythritol kinase